MRPIRLRFSAALLLAFFGSSLLGADVTYLTYDKFIAEVDAGSVKSVTLDRFSQISGTYVVDGTERPFKSFGETGSANDVLLTRLLDQKAVAVTLKDQKERDSFWADGGFIGLLLLGVVPITTLILAFRINSKLNLLPK
jgi:ATP-dependent Zn protease